MDGQFLAFSAASEQSSRATWASGATTSTSSYAPNTVAKKPVRRDPEARREQNRQASRAYRAKRKQKLALLDQLVAQEDHSPASPGLSSNDLRNSSSQELDRSAGAFERAVFQASTAINNHMLTSNLTDHGFDNWSSTIPSSRPRPASSQSRRGEIWDHPDDRSHLSPADLELPTVLIGEPSPSVLTSGAKLSSTSTDTPSSFASTSPPSKAYPPDAELLKVLDHVNNLSPSQKRLLLAHLNHSTGSVPREPSRTFTPTAIPGTNWVSYHPRSGHPLSRLQDEARRFAAFIDTHIHASLSPANLSKLYVMEVGFYGAVFANCYALGMSDLEGMMTEDGVSPFSLGPDTGYHPSQLPVVRPRFAAVTPDLRPIDLQLTVGHHPYLDIIPFKIFRENALKALQQEDGSLDEDQLCTDLGAGGLVCWGSQQSSLGMEAGVPWDVRAWEPQTWFLQKYWYLCGGWEDEMWKSCRWWHDTRGQGLDVSETTLRG